MNPIITKITNTDIKDEIIFIKLILIIKKY